MKEYFLVGDMGGTKTEFAVYSSCDDCRNYELIERFDTYEFKSPGVLINNFIHKHNLQISKLILAVAGPVLYDKITKSSSNLPWEVDRYELVNETGIPELYLINDLEALARAVPLLHKDEIITLNEGIKQEYGTLAVIAAGTGLGEAFMIWDGSKYQPCVSEGAHVNFGPRNKTEIELLEFIASSNNHVTYELVCSGLGILNIYKFLKSKKRYQEPGWMADQMQEAVDKTQLIVKSALKGKNYCRIASETLILFASVLAAETGNLVLKTMATGGVYLGGGLPGKISSFLKKEDFLTAYSDKGIMQEMMLNVPIHIIDRPESTILGAADYLFHKVRDGLPGRS